eukprot:NODE_10_length_61504_cov_0.956502.p28 type:complete len:252 gc:universal NODE_10_length_61504_cov_0.956502:19869-19114(-)
MTFDLDHLNVALRNLKNTELFVYWDQEGKLGTEFVPFYLHPCKIIFLWTSTSKMHAGFLELNDSLRAGQILEKEGQIIVPCQSINNVGLVLHLIIGNLMHNNIKLTVISTGIDKESIACWREFRLPEEIELHFMERHYWKNELNRNKTKFGDYYNAICAALQFRKMKNRHPVISKNEYIMLFSTLCHHQEVFNKMIEDRLLKPGKSFKYSKEYELKEYDDDFTFIVELPPINVIIDVHKRILGHDVLLWFQ